jgi:hypothetical protein
VAAVIYGPQVLRKPAAARLPLSPAIVAQLRAADPQCQVDTGGPHGTVSGLRQHSSEQTDFCQPCTALLDDLMASGLVRERDERKWTP